MTKLLRKPVVLQRCGISSSTLHRLIQEGAFPRPIQIANRAVAWVEHEIEEWIASRMRNR